MDEDLARVATAAAQAALSRWRPEAPDAHEILATAIGQAVAAGIRRHEEYAARHTAWAMAGAVAETTGDDLLDWQV